MSDNNTPINGVRCRPHLTIILYFLHFLDLEWLNADSLITTSPNPENHAAMHHAADECAAPCILPQKGHACCWWRTNAEYPLPDLAISCWCVPVW
jgi:hypothetical protein